MWGYLHRLGITLSTLPWARAQDKPRVLSTGAPSRGGVLRKPEKPQRPALLLLAIGFHAPKMWKEGPRSLIMDYVKSISGGHTKSSNCLCCHWACLPDLLRYLGTSEGLLGYRPQVRGTRPTIKTFTPFGFKLHKPLGVIRFWQVPAKYRPGAETLSIHPTFLPLFLLVRSWVWDVLRAPLSTVYEVPRD